MEPSNFNRIASEMDWVKSAQYMHNVDVDFETGCMAVCDCAI